MNLTRGRVVCFLLSILIMLSGLHQVAAEDTFLSRAPGTEFRLMSYNPYWDAIFSSGTRRYDRSDEFRRVLAAVKPDIACLQEIDPRRDRQEVLSIFNAVLPLPPGEQWHIASGADNVIVSRFPILSSRGEAVQGRGTRERGHVLALINTSGDEHPGLAGTAGGAPASGVVLVAGTHFTSGGSSAQIQARTEHAAALVAHIREFAAEHGGSDAHGNLDSLAVIIAGDLNAYGTDPRRHLDILSTGFAPLLDLQPRHNAGGTETWTWRDDTQEFPPFALDRVLYTGSLLVAEHSFVFNPSQMTETDRASSGVEPGDVALNLGRGNFDHLPLVADFGNR